TSPAPSFCVTVTPSGAPEGPATRITVPDACATSVLTLISLAALTRTVYSPAVSVVKEQDGSSESATVVQVFDVSTAPVGAVTVTTYVLVVPPFQLSVGSGSQLTLTTPEPSVVPTVSCVTD